MLSNFFVFFLTHIEEVTVFAFSDNLSAENPKLSAVSGNQRNQLLECMMELQCYIRRVICNTLGFVGSKTLIFVNFFFLNFRAKKIRLTDVWNSSCIGTPVVFTLCTFEMENRFPDNIFAFTEFIEKNLEEFENFHQQSLIGVIKCLCFSSSSRWIIFTSQVCPMVTLLTRKLFEVEPPAAIPARVGST